MATRHMLIGFATAVFTVAIIFLAYTLIFTKTEDGTGIDFNKIGNIVRNNPGMEPDTWYLLYEEPGKPGLSVALQFDIASACAVNTPAAPCDPEKLEQGARVRVEGREVEGGVLVRTMQSPEVIPTVETATKEPLGPSTSTTTTTATTTTGTSTATTTISTSTGSTGNNTMLTVKLYYYNPSLDQGPGGAQCSRAGLVAVNRSIPRTKTPLQDTISLLIRGELTPKERESGITTEFPLSGLSLASASVRKEVLTLTFNDPQNKTVGGSCRVAILWSQIETTAKQFAGIESVKYRPADLFQP